MSFANKLIKSLKGKDGVNPMLLNDVKNMLSTKDEDFVKTKIPMLNVALGGSVDAGLEPGITTFAGASKHFKTSYGLECLEAFQRKFKDGVVVIFDCEFGIADMIDNYDVDMSRIIHQPITNVEDLIFGTMNILENYDKNDKLMIMVDSIGNLASKKEVEDAMNEKAVADMTRAKALKGYFRMITPLIKLNNIYTYFVAHTYKEISLFPKDIVGGGTGIMFASNTCVIVGKSQEKDGKDLLGFTFTLNIEKSRRIKEKSKIPIIATYEEGVHPYSGLAQIAEEVGIVERVRKRGYYLSFKDKEIKEKESSLASAKEFWEYVFNNSDLSKCIESMYSLNK